MNCLLCGEKTAPFHEDKCRAYLVCTGCFCVQVPREFHLSREREKDEYDKHQNSPADLGYRQFLNRAVLPLDARLGAPSRGLDFGCGPGPTLSQMLIELGHQVALYDKFYYPETAALRTTYQFITLTEVAEHLSDPLTILDHLWGLLEPGGLLLVMTKRVTSAEAFKTWHYKNDLTHITFFHERSFVWLAEHWHAHLEFSGPDVVIFEKPRSRVTLP